MELSSKCMCNCGFDRNRTAGAMITWRPCWRVVPGCLALVLLVKAAHMAAPLTYKRGNSHSSWSGQWAEGRSAIG